MKCVIREISKVAVSVERWEIPFFPQIEGLYVGFMKKTAFALAFEEWAKFHLKRLNIQRIGSVGRYSKL